MLVPKGVKWDRTEDVVVIGYGLAGAVAAIVTRDLGGKVVLLEKQPAHSLCTFSSISTGVILCPEDVKGAIKYMMALAKVDEKLSWTDEDNIRIWAEYASQNKSWLEGLGGNLKFFRKVAEFEQFPGSESMQSFRYQGSGLVMMEFMYEQVASRKIDVLYETTAQRLLTNTEGRIIGVKVIRIQDGKQKEMNIKASKAVILCTGGFEDNEEMKLQYLRMYPVYFSGGTSNTGDGIKMAQEVGADLWHMNCCSARLLAKYPDFPIGLMLEFGGRGWTTSQVQDTHKMSDAGFIIVNKHGRRYLNENMKIHGAFYEITSYDTHRLEYPAVPSYYIFDQRRMDNGPIVLALSGAAGPHQLYKWSYDNQTELKKGWIIKGDTLAQLAAKIQLSPDILEKTAQTWNSYCKKGSDPEFGRRPTEMVPLDAPPFYAIKLLPGGPNTQGGPRRNSKAQVLNPFGEPIPGLYIAGECGSIFSMLYPVGGGNLSECIVFGRIAAENATKEKAIA